MKKVIIIRLFFLDVGLTFEKALVSQGFRYLDFGFWVVVQTYLLRINNHVLDMVFSLGM